LSTAIRIGWTQLEALKVWRGCGRLGIQMGGCILFRMQGTMVRLILFLVVAFEKLTTSFAVYLDNHKAVNQLLLKELDR
jgi:hypothetical protein